MDRIEKIVWIVTGLVVLVVIALAKIGPLKSDVSKAQVASDADKIQENKTNPFLLAAQRAQQTGVRQQFVPSRSNFPDGTPRAQGRPQIGGAVVANAASGQTAPADGRNPRSVAPAVNVMPGQQPPLTPATTNDVPAQQVETVYIPSSAVEKYQHFDDLVDLGNTAEGEDVPFNGGTAFQLNKIYENSPLASQLGFQAGDKIIAVNGYPATMGNARQLYETLKNQREFQVEIDRGGQRMTIPYHVK